MREYRPAAVPASPCSSAARASPSIWSTTGSTGGAAPGATAARRSTNWRSWLSGWAPTKPSTGRPPAKAKTAGIDCTRNWPASAWFLSTSILTSRTLPFCSLTTFSRAGPSCLHGPHHVAQKSTITGVSCDASITSLAKLAVSESLITSAPAAPPSPISMSMETPAPSGGRVASYMAERAAPGKGMEARGSPTRPAALNPALLRDP